MNSPRIAFVPVCRSVSVFALRVCVCLSLCVCLSFFFFFFRCPLPSSVFYLVQVVPRYLFVHQGVEIPLNQHLHHEKIKVSIETQIKESVLDVVIVAALAK